MDLSLSKMRLKYKRLLNALAVVLLFSLGTVAVFRVAHNRQQTSKTSTDSKNWYAIANLWQERAPMSVAEDVSIVDQDQDFERDETSVGSVQPSTATAKPHVTLDDIFISVKTTQKYHRSRLDVVLKTWFLLSREQTWFFTDADDEEYSEKTYGHLINTNCSSSHNRMALCCKMSVELDTFLASNKRWFCHFDDDNYVNVPQLVRTLQNFPWQEDWYLGKPSIKAPLEILDRDNIPQKLSFWFATGGAGLCISRALALKMMPIASGGKFVGIGDKIRLPDDVTLGYIIEHMLQKKLTVIEEFHSHLEPMKFVKNSNLADQISFSYSRYGQEMNVLNVDGFDSDIDPHRFLSLHCLLFPNFSFCPRAKKNDAASKSR